MFYFNTKNNKTSKQTNLFDAGFFKFLKIVQIFKQILWFLNLYFTVYKSNVTLVFPILTIKIIGL